MNNVVVLSGILGRDIEVKYTPSGKSVAQGSIAIHAGKDENRKTEWFNLVFWEGAALSASKNLKKGDKVTVIGRLSSRKYTNRDKVEVTTTEIVVSTFSMPQVKEEPKKPVEASEDDIPF